LLSWKKPHLFVNQNVETPCDERGVRNDERVSKYQRTSFNTKRETT
jgi:hypothetical protein